jgi:hypothetical protein
VFSFLKIKLGFHKNHFYIKSKEKVMFYVVETNEQLEELFHKEYDKVFIEPIYFNDNIHPSLNHISLLYIKPLNDDKGYIVCITHSETLSLNKTPIKNLISSYEEIYVRDRKSFIRFYPFKNIVDISFGIEEYVEPTTNSHDFFYQRHGEKDNINLIIPIVKHYEKCEAIFNKIKDYCIKPTNVKFHNKLTSIFFLIEESGLKIDPATFNKFFEINNESFSIYDDTIYTQYNLHTTTGRPSNSFNGINFAALKKDDGCRESFIFKNDYLVEIDISSYHPTLAAQLVKYEFDNETPYQYFAREANIKIEEAKILMFKQLYGGIYKEYQSIPYFQLIQKYIDELWEKFNSQGFIECPISGHILNKSIKDLNPQKLFNYLLQNLETSTNVLILWEIIKLLKGKPTDIILYTYDAILIDYKEEDNLLEQINQIFKKYNLKTKTTKGSNYGTMSII